MPQSRREFMQWVAAVTAASQLPLAAGCGSGTPSGFFSDDERKSLGALADAILPPDDQPGGKALGAALYIERLLTAFDRLPDAPDLLAGGPYSGRAPIPDGMGGASTTSPPNDFASFVALDRVQLAAWRFALYGSPGYVAPDGTKGHGPNDAIVGPRVGLRDQMKQGIAAATAMAGRSIADLDAAGLAALVDNLDPDFRNLLVELVYEAAFAAPEYGGNPNGAGWKMVHFEGDQMPLGFSIWDDGAKQYRERADYPMSTANPGPDPEPVDDEVHKFVAGVVKALGGRVNA